MIGPNVRALIKLWQRQGYISIAAELERAVDKDQAEPVELDLLVDPRDALLDQGVTRLQLLAFLRGDDSEGWNWNGKNDGPRWVRFRGHVVDRWDTLDGQIVRLTYTENDGTTRPASWTMRQTADLDYNAAAVARNIDQIIDAAIAHHGADGVA
jgi:hypothetical protein